MGNPDPKTVSNATRVNEPNDNNNRVVEEHDIIKAVTSEETSPYTPQSDQPEELERKAREESEHEEKGRKKKVIEGGEYDTSHATIGKNEEKEARAANKEAKKSK